MTELDLDALDFTKGGGLVTVVAQDAATGAVLMVAHADREALERTIATGEMHYRSRTRGLWHKGATSGHTQTVRSLHPDCDGDTVLALVVPNGPACHTGSPTCFGTPAERPAPMAKLARTIASRVGGDPASSYTAKLLADRNTRLKKLGEEAAELAVACADEDPTRAVEEAADLLYHTLVALQAMNRSWNDLETALQSRSH